MALVKETLRQSLYKGLCDIYTAQANKATSGDENEDPYAIIKQIANDMAKVISDSVDAYIKSGDIVVGPSNISVVSTAPGTAAVLTPLQPSKIQ